MGGVGGTEANVRPWRVLRRRGPSAICSMVVAFSAMLTYMWPVIIAMWAVAARLSHQLPNNSAPSLRSHDGQGGETRSVRSTGSATAARLASSITIIVDEEGNTNVPPEGVVGHVVPLVDRAGSK